ncbi:MAG: DUF805 domain-containing protein [bacterium]
MSENIDEILEINSKSTNQSSSEKKSLGEILFSFSGRICRSEYWGKAFPILFSYSIIVNIIYYAEVESSGQPGISIFLSLLSLWPGIAVATKRLHDRNRSGLFLLTLLIPFVNVIFAIWIIIEVWFLKGTEGENRFGPDPLA